MVDIKKYFKRHYLLSIDELDSINEMLKTDISIKKALEVVTNSKNKVIFDEIISRLETGDLIEDVIKKYLPRELSSYCLPLLKTMNFSASLDLSLSFYKKGKENAKELEKAILYPFVLLFVSLSALYLFDAYGLDSILDMLKSFDTNIDSFKLIRIIFRIIVYVFYFSMLIGVGLIYYFSKDKNITLFYCLVSKYFKNSLFQVYFCEEFTSLFIICTDLGYKTKEALLILRGLHNKPIVSFLAYHLDDKLLEGDNLKAASEQIYYDETLTRTIKIAMYTNNFTGLLSEYINLSRQKIKVATKKLTLIIQLGSYIVIGAIIIFIYQILFLPMQAITAF